MNKHWKNMITLLSILTLLLLILFQSGEVKQNIITATELWITQVFPSLFPMFIVSDLLIHYHFPELLANILGKPFAKIFHTSSYGIFVFIMSILSGTPSSAFILKDLTEEGKLTKEEASFLLSFTFFSNPLFLINMLSRIFPNNQKYILLIILIHYSTNLIIGLLLRPKKQKEMTNLEIPKRTQDLGTILCGSIKKTMDTLLLILGTICFYYMLANLIKVQNPLVHLFIRGFCELTQGLNAIVPINITDMSKALIAIGFISFGGLSIHTQVKSIIKDTKISYKPFLKGRILHVLISIFLLWTIGSTIT